MPLKIGFHRIAMQAKIHRYVKFDEAKRNGVENDKVKVIRQPTQRSVTCKMYMHIHQDIQKYLVTFKI